MTKRQSLVQRFLTGGSFPRYLVVGVFTSLLDLSLFSLLALLLHVPEIPANVVSTIVTVCVSYLINRRFVFKAQRSTWGTFFSFAGMTLFTGLVIQSVIIWAVVSGTALVAASLSAALVKPSAKVIAMGVGALCNYFGYRFIFRSSTVDSA